MWRDGRVRPAATSPPGWCRGSAIYRARSRAAIRAAACAARLFERTTGFRRRCAPRRDATGLGRADERAQDPSLDLRGERVGIEAGVGKEGACIVLGVDTRRLD